MPSELRSSAPAHATGAVEFVSLDDVVEDERFRLRPDGDVAPLATSIGRLGQLVPVELRPWPGAANEGPRWQVVAGFRRLAALRLLQRERVLARLHGPLPDEEGWALALAHAVLGEPLTAAEIEALREKLAAAGEAAWAGDALDEALARAPLDPGLRERFFEFVKGPLAPVVERYEVEEEGPVGGGGGGGGGATPTSTAAEAATATATPAGPGAAAEAATTPFAVREGAGSEAASGDRAGAEPRSDELVEVDADELLHGIALRLYEVNQDLAAAFASWQELPAEGRQLVLAQARYVAELFPFLEEGPRE